MSDLYRSSMQARIAKLPDLASLGIEDNDEDEEEEEENDNLSALPGSGLGPPAM
jgi:protein phosphatase methylesterase 1